ncbi:MAG: hypothetical protein J5I93_09535 [Pirellulaceae bacterium]|nr:hypothetical protein [Pirellulaceae bacterium]
MLYLGYCRHCGAGLLGLRRCGQGHLLVLCDECDALWQTSDLGQPPQFPPQPDLPCPHCGQSLNGPTAHWASLDEVRQAGWNDALIVGPGGCSAASAT